MKYLVLGSEGQIGAPLVEFLTKEGHEVEEYDLVLNLTVRAFNYGSGGNINGQPTNSHVNNDGKYYTVI